MPLSQIGFCSHTYIGITYRCHGLTRISYIVITYHHILEFTCRCLIYILVSTLNWSEHTNVH
ncbi:hypothetical protein F383_24577 [Gossypium arboreum]|uniref:Uncharacterized protein n=1 Tax=Gossypium arboreum TaxID=29729 RepID=A0A0B0NYF4_GOSAR|nr:hypothetical protein F383_24577 [Gossypium arboreum]